jgi:probable phosphoglycerate mutase
MLKPGVTLYFVRHGETDWNLAQRYQGQQDIPLNATGRAQAARNGRTLAAALGGRAREMHFVASPLLRACETMRIVRGELGLEPETFATDARLREISYGHWEGQLSADLAASDPDGIAARQADTWGWQPRGGESYSMLSERVAAWLAEVERDSIVVAHGGVSRVLRVLAGGLPPSELLAVGVPQDKVLVVERGGMDWL